MCTHVSSRDRFCKYFFVCTRQAASKVRVYIYSLHSVDSFGGGGGSCNNIKAKNGTKANERKGKRMEDNRASEQNILTRRVESNASCISNLDYCFFPQKSERTLSPNTFASGGGAINCVARYQQCTLQLSTCHNITTTILPRTVCVCVFHKSGTFITEHRFSGKIEQSSAKLNKKERQTRTGQKNKREKKQEKIKEKVRNGRDGRRNGK